MAIYLPYWYYYLSIVLPPLYIYPMLILLFIYLIFTIIYLANCTIIYLAFGTIIYLTYWYCRRPALVAPSLGVVGTSRSSVRVARPTTTTEEDNVGSFGLKEMDERRTESREVLPLPAASGNVVRPHRRELRRCPRLVRRVSVSSI